MNALPVKALTALLVLLISEMSFAICAVQVNPATIVIPTSISINATGVGNGSALTPWYTASPIAQIFRCNPNNRVDSNATGVNSSIASTYIESSRTYTIYPTGIAGVGVVISTRDPNTSWLSVYQGETKRLIRGYFAVMGNISQARFVRTGDIFPGSYSMAALHVANLDAFDAVDRTTVTSRLMLGNTTLNITGPTCDLATTDANRTITLDSIRLSDFTGVSAGKKSFEITANCSTHISSVTFKFTGTPTTISPLIFKNTGTAANVGLSLYSRIGGTEAIIGANGTNNTRTVSVSGNRAVLPLGASYYRTGTPGKGSLQSTATVNITYN